MMQIQYLLIKQEDIMPRTAKPKSKGGTKKGTKKGSK